MLAPGLLDWWFTPWTYGAAAGPSGLPWAYPLSQRDGYRLWCDRAAIPADLPASLDPGWSVAVCRDGALLRAAARLYSGLLASRNHDQDALHGYDMADRKWCAAIAATQPLSACYKTATAAPLTPEMHGLIELALLLQQGFAGLWERLALLLAVEERALLAQMLADRASHSGAMPSASRAQRAWRLCLQHAAERQAPV